MGARFPMAGTPMAAGATPAPGRGGVPVPGLSQHRGASIHRPQAEVVPMLLTGVCSGSGGSADCDPCKTGGPGSPGCDIDCGDGENCSAECASGNYACCNCAGRCACCADRSAGAPVKK